MNAAHSLWPAARVLLALGLAACAGADPMPPQDSYSVSVTVSTTGEDPDADGYVVTLGTDQVAVAANGSAAFDGLSSGAYDVSLGGLAPNCVVVGSANVSAVVGSPGGATVQFDVLCESVLVAGAFSDAVCPGFSLGATSGAPLSLVSVGTVPGDLTAPLFAYVTWSGGDERLVSIADPSTGGGVTLVVPYHPSGSMDGGAVSIRIAGGTHACPPAAFTIDPLPAAPGEVGEVVDLLQEIVTLQAGLVGTTVAELQSLDGTSLPAVQMIPLLAAQSVIDHPSNPNSLRAVVDGSAPFTAGIDVEALDRAMAATGLRAALEASVGPSAVGGARAGGPARIDALDCLASTLSTAQDLHDCMELAASAAFRLDGASGQVLSDIGTAAGVVGQVPNPGVKLGSAFFSAAAFALQKLREGTANLLPSEFASMELTASPTTFLEDQAGPGAWTAEVTAVSNGWELDQAVLGSLSQLAGGLSSYGAWLDRFADAEGAVDLAGFVVNQVVSEAIDASGGAGVLTVPSETFGPVDVSAVEWSDRSLVPEVAVVAMGHDEYEPREPGETVLSVRTKDGKFGGKQISKQQPLRVEALQLSISPDEVTLAPGQTQEFTVTVTSSAHPDSVDLHPGNSLAGEAEITYGGGDVHTVTYTAPPAPTPSDPDLLTVWHTATGGARGFSDQERTATATIRFVRVQLAPVLECVEPGDTVQLQATVTPPGDYELTWSASAGNVTSSGFFTAPNEAGSVVVTVALASNPDIMDTITIPVGPCICQFTVRVGGGATYVGQPGDQAEYFAFETGNPSGPWAVGYVSFQTTLGETALFAVDIAESQVTGPGSYPVPEIGGDIGFGSTYATYTGDGATMVIYEFTPNTTLVGEIVNGVVRDTNDPDAGTMSIEATFNIYPTGPFYGTGSCVVGGGGS